MARDPCWVYILRSERTGRYYIGSAEDPGKRVDEHNCGCVDSTAAHRPWVIVHREVFGSRAVAVRREREIKSKKSRRWIEYNLLAQAQGSQEPADGLTVEWRAYSSVG